MAQLVQNPPAMLETWVPSLGWEDSQRRERLPTSVFWPGEFHGLYRPWDHKELDMTEELSLHFTVRKHLTKGFLCAVLDLWGTLWPLLIPEYSGIKRRGTPFLGLRNLGIFHYSDKYPLPYSEPNGKKWSFATLSLIGVILCFVSLEF